MTPEQLLESALAKMDLAGRVTEYLETVQLTVKPNLGVTIADVLSVAHEYAEAVNIPVIVRMDDGREITCKPDAVATHVGKDCRDCAAVMRSRSEFACTIRRTFLDEFEACEKFRPR